MGGCALSVYNIASENLSFPPAQVLANAVSHHLGRFLGMLTVAAVIVLVVLPLGAAVALVFAAYVLRRTRV